MNARRIALVMLACACVLVAAEPTPLKPDPIWQGAAKNDSIEQSIPKVVSSKAKFAELWKNCERTDDVPNVDFTKNLVFVVTSRGSHISLRQPVLTEDGDLKVLAIETRDFRPGFRYVLAVFSRSGVKSVNGAELSK